LRSLTELLTSATGPKSRVNKVVLVTAFGTVVCKNLIIHLHDQQTRFRMLGVKYSYAFYGVFKRYKCTDTKIEQVSLDHVYNIVLIIKP
jgi:hypothetical protein